MSRTLVATLLLVLVAALAHADLGESLRKGARDEVVHEARRLGPAGLGKALAGDRASARAAAMASTEIASPWLMLAALATAAESAERTVAVPAAVSAAEIAASLGALEVIERDLDRGQLRLTLGAWLRLAKAPGRWTDVRVLALETATHLAPACGLPAQTREFLDDPDPEVRRAALELLPTDDVSLLAQQLVHIIEDDSSADVALVAAQVLCENPSAPSSPAALERLGNLIQNPDLTMAARVGGLACFSGKELTKSMQEARTTLLRNAPAYIKKALKSSVE